MNIYDYAMEMEKDGEAYYRELAEKTGNSGLKNILTMLADAEVVHWKLFRNMKENREVAPAESDIVDNVKNVFARMREEGTSGVDLSQVDLYRKAQELEEKSRDFYLGKAAEAALAEQKEVLLQIAEEEKRHYAILENIIDFISRPEQWLEDAEWYHLDEY